ncbi:hypothetical protein COLO4_26950 [Corchorus olitorius]|uniref:CRAL/TRIO N-terminal domain-containing protein n=1 Tax=Corchorus olitorius TaxID=93759 RepID=A0A1R3HTL5_9ROSI|nr:hypothetical protein COLO4_26950 [Corchorus olitorius]
MPSKRHEGTDIVLAKFLKAKDYKVHEALEMLRNTLKWRNEFKENLGPDVEFSKQHTQRNFRTFLKYRLMEELVA